MIQKTTRCSILKINFLKSIIIKSLIIIILSILTESVQAQGCSINLKIKDPAPVCSPSTVDLTSDLITSGSTSGLKFSYYLNPELTIPVPFPAKVGNGTYYIKGVLSGICNGSVVSSINATVNESPRVVIPNPVIKRVSATVDLTLPQITTGSDAGLTFSYWSDATLTNPILTPKTAGLGTYFIKGTSASGCSSFQSITVSD
jgi:hypothetical protein